MTNDFINQVIDHLARYHSVDAGVEADSPERVRFWEDGGDREVVFELVDGEWLVGRVEYFAGIRRVSTLNNDFELGTDPTVKNIAWLVGKFA